LPASDTFSGFFVMAAVEGLGGPGFLVRLLVVPLVAADALVVDLVVVVAKMLNKMFRRESTECYLSKTVALQSKILIFHVYILGSRSTVKKVKLSHTR